MLGPAHDIPMIGKGRSTLDAPIEGIAEEMRIVVLLDQRPEQGSLYRSDLFSAGISSCKCRDDSTVESWR